jgi:hypothetical protein
MVKKAIKAIWTTKLEKGLDANSYFEGFSDEVEEKLYEKVKIKVAGYSQNEGSREFEILKKEKIEKIINNIDMEEIWKRTFKKANGYTSGTAYTYIDTRTGKIVTSWLQQYNELHPWDSFYEIVLCSIKTPVFDFEAKDLLDEEEQKDFFSQDNYIDIEEFIRGKYGDEELEERIEEAIDWYACEFVPDWDNIENQIINLYRKVEE